ncbi:MAG TPA: DUF4038 domain-containing protein [Terriglobales bacterium]|nr:DUF4038 domain-containing protein [Terriglobales bacterium]
MRLPELKYFYENSLHETALLTPAHVGSDTDRHAVDGNQTSPLLRSIHPGNPQTSVTQFAPGGAHPVPWLDFHMLQSGHVFEREFVNNFQIRQTDELIDAAYAISSPKPVFDGEPMYENIVNRVWVDLVNTNANSPRADASIVPFKAYEAVFAGAFGHTYAHENTDYLWTVGDDPNRPFTGVFHGRQQ